MLTAAPSVFALVAEALVRQGIHAAEAVGVTLDAAADWSADAYAERCR